MSWLICEFILIGIAGGLLGIFYRNCLKVDGMIFNFIYTWLNTLVETPRVKESISLKPNIKDKVLAFVAYPLGYCIYCSTAWITIFLSMICMNNLDWRQIIVALVTSLGVQHLVVCIACRWLINGHPDLDE